MCCCAVPISPAYDACSADLLLDLNSSGIAPWSYQFPVCAHPALVQFYRKVCVFCLVRNLFDCRLQPRSMAQAEQFSRRDSALEMLNINSNTGSFGSKPKSCTDSQHQQLHRKTRALEESDNSCSRGCQKPKFQRFMRSKGMSWFKRIASVPCKRLFVRSGAEVHDSTGLDQAISMYLYAAGHPHFQQPH